MQRPFRQQADTSILDRAAELIAKRGLDKTSVQDVADAVGISKTGLLYHFSSKQVLYQSILERAGSVRNQLMEQVAHLPAGPSRDLAVIGAVVEAFLAHPGLLGMVMAQALGSDDSAPAPDDYTTFVHVLFGDDPTELDLDREVRVTVAMAAVALLSGATPPPQQTTAWRRALVNACYDALGHRRRGTTLTDVTPQEA